MILNPNQEIWNEITKASRELSLFQRHNGVARIAKTAVVQDYAARLYNGIRSCKEIIARMVSQKQAVNYSSFLLSFERQNQSKKRHEIFPLMKNQTITNKQERRESYVSKMATANHLQFSILSTFFGPLN